jgi:1-deoxy-D-xylulose-5-phosphate reductoisomerase
LRLAFAALAAGGTMPAVANAANEVAVARFLARDITFMQIPEVIEAVMRAHAPRSYESVDDVLAVDAWARALAAEQAGERAAARG